MKGATQCARRVKQVLRTLRAGLGRVNRPQSGDPITQMILGILTRDAPESKAREALDRMKSMVVDYNELRVIPSLELAEHVGEYPDVRTKCEDVSRALNRVFAIEHTVSMDRLAGASRSDVNNYLNGIAGLDGYSRARVKLLGFGIHAIPLDAAMWAYARQQGIVDEKCSLEEAQAFLERQVDEADALEFVALLRKAAWGELGSAVRKGEVEEIRSIPPDRTTRNMLQLIASGGSLDAPSDIDGELSSLEGLESGEDGPASAAAEESDKPARKTRKSGDGKGSRADRKSKSSAKKTASTVKSAKPARKSVARARSA
jgi:hypothetical protein